jgi:hypothetical protein
VYRGVAEASLAIGTSSSNANSFLALSSGICRFYRRNLFLINEPSVKRECPYCRVIK